MFSRRDLVKLIIPLIVEQILAATIGIADTVMVASCGETAVSGVSLVDSINILLIFVFAALATGGAIVSSQYIGRRDDEQANVAAKQLILVTTLVSAVLMVVCLAGRTAILKLIFGTVEPAVMENAKTYFLLTALSYPFIAVYNACAALFRAQGNSKISMIASFVMNVTNVAGNAVLIYIFQMGVAGAGTATLVSRVLGAGFLLFLLYNENNRIHVNGLFKTKLQPAMIKNILKIGIPNGLENGMFHIGKILVQGLIASFGTMAIAANAVTNSVMTVAQMPGSAICLAMVTVVGQCVGAREYGQAKRYALQLIGVVYVVMGLLNLGMLFLLNPIIATFGLANETAALAWQMCLICCLGDIVIWPIAFVLPCALRAANDVKYTMTVSIISMWLFRVGLSYIVARGLQIGAVGVWICMIIDWIVRAVAFMTRFIRGKWKTKQLI